MNESVRHSSLPDADLARVERLKTHQDPEVAWLAEKAFQLARLKITDFHWPEFAGLRSVNGCYAVRRDQEGARPREQRFIARGEQVLEYASILKLKTECRVTDAWLTPRPYLIALDDLSLQILRARGTIMVATGGTVLFKGPALEFLADRDGFGVSRIPSLLKYPRPWPDAPVGGLSAFSDDCIFGSATVSEDLREAYAEPYGVFLAHGADVIVSLDVKLDADEILDVFVGLLMNRYTTKGLPLSTSTVEFRRRLGISGEEK